MNGRPLLTSIDLWGNHERRCLRILRDALELLEPPGDNEREVDINRRLYFCLVRASHAIAAGGSGETLPAPVPEARNAPSATDEERATREHKIPDFQWGYIDHLASNPAAAARQFVVECKRLTVASKNWVYTEQYVQAGIARFVSPEHAYGKDTPSGAMVGYLQTMQLDQALDEVNRCAVAERLAELALTSQNSARRIELEHALDRTFAETPFRLVHLWLRA